MPERRAERPDERGGAQTSALETDTLVRFPDRETTRFRRARKNDLVVNTAWAGVSGVNPANGDKYQFVGTSRNVLNLNVDPDRNDVLMNMHRTQLIGPEGRFVVLRTLRGVTNANGDRVMMTFEFSVECK